MQWEKRICIRITARRIMVAILIAASSLNLIIVGVAFETVSTTTPTLTSLSHTQNQTATFSLATATLGNTTAPISGPTKMFTPIGSSTFTSTPTSTTTGTSTSPPTPTQCVPKSYWYAYYVQGGDTLYALSLSTGSTVDELKLANCLSENYIYPGQLLFVPRLPINITMPLPSSTPTNLPTVAQTDTPTVTSTYTPSFTPTSTPTPTFTDTPYTPPPIG